MNDIISVRNKGDRIMLSFIVLDFGEFEVKLFEEREFIDKYDVEPLDPKEYPNASERITELVEGNCYDLAWCRQDAVDRVIDEIELLSVEEDGDDQTLIKLAQMLITIGNANWWDGVIDHNSDLSIDIEPDFDL